MNIINIQIQSILYKSNADNIIKSIAFISKAIDYFNKSVEEKLNINIKYGDASENPVFTEEQIMELKKTYPNINNIEYFYFNENTGTAKGHNRLALNSNKEYLMIMNPDVLVSSDIFIEMLKPFRTKSINCGIVEGRQTPIEHPKKFKMETGETNWASTACVLVLKEAFDKVGGFDEGTFFLYGDDVDFSWMVRLMGYKVIYQATACVNHPKQLTIRGKWQPSSIEIYYALESALLMAHKWSNNNLLKDLLNSYKEKSNIEAYKKAYDKYMSMLESNTLPKQLDSNHKIAIFENGNYGNMKYKL